MLVSAFPGRPCPRADDPSRSIGETPVEVPESSYYRRRLADGSLRVVSPPVPAAKGAKKGASE